MASNHNEDMTKNDLEGKKGESETENMEKSRIFNIFCQNLAKQYHKKNLIYAFILMPCKFDINTKIKILFVEFQHL